MVHRSITDEAKVYVTEIKVVSSRFVMADRCAAHPAVRPAKVTNVRQKVCRLCRFLFQDPR